MFFEQKVFSYYQRNRENLAPWIFLPSPIFELVSLFSFSRLPVFDQPLVKQLCSKIFLTRLKQKVTFSLHGASRFLLLLKKKMKLMRLDPVTLGFLETNCIGEK